MPHAVAGGGDLVDAAAGGRAVGLVLDDGAVVTAGVPVVFFHQQPGLAVAVLAPARAHEHPSAFELLAAQLELEPPLAIPFARILVWHPGAAIPQHHGARAVLLRRDDAFEAPVLEGMVLDVHGEPAHGWIQAGALRNRPRQQHPVELQPEVVVQLARCVLLDDERQRPHLAPADATARLGRDAKITLLAVDLECHGCQNRETPVAAGSFRLARGTVTRRVSTPCAHPAIALRSTANKYGRDSPVES